MKAVEISEDLHAPVRELRVAELIREHLSGILHKDLRDPRIRPADITVTDVRVSRGGRRAVVYFTCIGHDPEAKSAALKVLCGASGYLRSSLARRHAMRRTPELSFLYDEISERGSRVDDLLGSPSLAHSGPEVADP